MQHTWTRYLTLLAVAGVISACGEPETNSDPVDDFGLDDSAAYAGAYEESQNTAAEIKADQTLPPQFDLVATQTPILSQGSRGVCSVFGTVALMEHLYISEGTITNPDFSEQFLQWSAKVEGGSFPNSGGSNARSNLDAIYRFGIVEEAEWPYESSPWGTSDDEACTGDNRPTRCYTNGEPPAAALEAQRYRLPRGRWLNNSAESLKSHMFNTNTAVQIGGDFFYQAWGHGGSELTVHSPYRSLGYILAPNQADLDDSNMRPAGHSYIAVGWDDELSVQSVDENGELAFDDAGEPIMQTGFFLIKNSWGDSWATDNPHGAGYGWIAYEYVENYLSAYVSGLPEVQVAEVCGDTRDNDFDDLIDCADPDCADDRACADPSGSYTNDTPVAIPDNDPAGAESTIVVADGGTISSATASVNISHTYRGDLTAFISFNGQSVQIASNEGGSEDNIIGTFDLAQFEGMDAAGDWTLQVVDSAGQDTGSIDSWTLNITRCSSTDCTDTPEVSTYTNDSLLVIPDNDETGVANSIVVSSTDVVRAARVTVNVSHTFPGDLVFYLSVDGGEEFEIAREIDATSDFMETFVVSEFNGAPGNGEWTLRVADVAARDEGTLNSWTLELTH